MAYQKLQTERAINVIPTTGQAKVPGLLATQQKIATIIPDPGKSIFKGSGFIPNAVTTAATGPATNDATLVDNKDFAALNVKPGHVIRITTTTPAGVSTAKFFTIKSVGGVGNKTITLESGTGTSNDNVAAASNSSILTANVSEYEIFDSEGTEPCVLYVGGAGDVHVLTAGGDEVTFKGVPAGTFIPVQVTKVFNINTAGPLTTATEIIALR